MSGWWPQRLPITVTPEPGEALDSWLEAYARRLSVTNHVFLSFIGLGGANPASMVQQLTREQADVLHQVSGVSGQALTAMTLQPFEGLTVHFRASRRGLARPPAWRFHGSSSRYCPMCLAQTAGRWPLAWRQPWSFACTVHRCLLLERCPACQQTVRAHGISVGGPTRPAGCTRGRYHAHSSGRSRIPCGFCLAEAPVVSLPPDGLLLAAQQHTDVLLREVTIRPDAARQRLQDLYALGWRALAGTARYPQAAPPVVSQVLAEIGDEIGGRVPAQTNAQEATDVRSIGVGTTLAYLAAPDPRPVEPALLDWILDVDQQLGPPTSPATRAHRWKTASSRLTGQVLARLDPDLRFLSRMRYGTASPHGYWRQLTEAQVQQRAAAIPSMLWPSWTMRLLPAALQAPRSVARFRQAASILVTLPGTSLTFSTAADLLGHPATGFSRLPRLLGDDPYHAVVSALTQLAWALDEQISPIDYARRRRLITESTVELDADGLHDVYGQLGWRHGDRVRSRQIRWYLLSLLHGSDHRDGGSSSNDVSAAATDAFRLRMPHLLRTFLHDQARANLTRLGIDEPVRWEPPLDWATLATSPGFTPDVIDQQLRGQEPHVQAPPAARSGLRGLAQRLGLSSQQLALYCESRDISLAPSQHDQTPQRAARVRKPRTGVLAPDQLRALYERQHKTQVEIAGMARCSTALVAKALREARIPIRQRRPDGALERAAPRAWLEHQYRDLGRSTPDIAREFGVDKNDVIKLLRKYQIPRRSDGRPTNPFASLTAELSPAMKEISQTPNAVQRLRQIVRLPGHRNLSAAAAALNTRPGTLSYQLSRIEHAAGFTIIERTRPLAATPRGGPFIVEAQHILDLLDQGTE